MNKTLVSALAILATASAFAATKFPDKDGSHDISSPAAWGKEEVPSGDVSFGEGSFNANANDVSFSGNIYCIGSSVVFDLLDTPTRKVEISASSKHFQCATPDSQVQLLGGNWTVTKDINIPGTATNVSVIVSNVNMTCRMPANWGVNSRIVFTGEDTVLTSSYGSQSILAGYGSAIIFSNGAKWSLKQNLYSCFYDDSTVSNNVFRIESGAEVTTTKDMRIGTDDRSLNSIEQGNRVEVLDGGTLKVANLTIAKTNNAVVVSNGTLTCSSISFAGGSGNHLEIRGENAVVPVMPSPLFAAGDSHEIVIADGATWALSGSYNTATNAGVNSCGVRVDNGGTLTVGGTIHVGYTDAVSNRLEVLDGGSLSCTKLELDTCASVLVVSNGTVKAETSSSTFGYNTSGGAIENPARVEIRGSKSKLTTGSKSVYLCGKTILHFAIPAEGYEAAPVEVGGTFQVDSGTSFTVDAEAFQRVIEGAMVVPLVKYGKISFKDTDEFGPNTVLADANAALAERKMEIVNDTKNKQLVLQVRPIKKGLTIILR